jgi:DNA-directed RNA polymerase subunit RPC12/RpoP
MSLKCSLLGHRFDETSVERDRQEDGSEVVTTITELETCSRCGETRIVSENKEVTTMETSDVDAGTDASVGTGSARGSGAGDAGRGDDAEILDDGTAAATEARRASVPDAESGSGPGPGAAGPGAPEPHEEDAVIIDGDGGEGTVADDGQPEVGSSDSSATGGETGVESRAETGTAGTVPESESGASEWPEEHEEEGDSEVPGEWPEETRRETPEQSGVTFEQSASPTVTVPEGMFKCSECGFTTEVESSSLRAGDFCPECHRGTLVQHEDG